MKFDFGQVRFLWCYSGLRFVVERGKNTNFGTCGNCLPGITLSYRESRLNYNHKKIMITAYDLYIADELLKGIQAG